MNYFTEEIMKRSKLYFWLAVMLIPAGAFAAFSSSDVGTAGAQFLKIAQGGRAVALGEAYGAVADDPYALYWNPAGLGQINQKMVSFNYTMWLQQVTNSYVAYAHPVPGWNSTFGISVNQSAVPAVDKYDNTGNAVGDTYTASDMAITLGYASMLSEGLSTGLNVKTIQSTIDDASASAFAVDMGLLYKPNKQSFCVVLQNLGSKMKYISQEDSLPMNLKIGTAYPITSKNMLLLLDVNAPTDNEMKLNLGCEFGKIVSRELSLAFRIGARTNVRGLDPMSAISAGFGIKWTSLDFDLGWVPYGDLGSAIRTSIGFRFGQPAARKVEAPAPVKAAVTVEPAKAPQLTQQEKNAALKKDYSYKGHAAYTEGKYEAALSWFNKVLDIEPDNADAMEYKEKIRAKQEEGRKAEQKKRDAEKYENFKKGQELYAAGKFKQAKPYFEKVLSIDPLHADSQDYLNRINKRIKK